MSASIVDLAEWVKATLTANIGLDSGGPSVTVERRWSVPSTDKDLGKLAGRKVEVWHTTYGTGADVTREKAAHNVTLAILVAERYVPDSGPNTGEPSTEWIDALVAWVETYIYNPLTATGDETNPNRLILGAWWTQNVEIVTVCDPETLRSHGVFWSEISITFSNEE